MANAYFNYKTMPCATCGVMVQRTGPKQRFCSPCPVEHRNAKRRERYASDPGKHKERAKAYYEANLDQCRARSAAWFAAHKGYQAERYRADPIAGRKKAAKWRAENIDRVRARRRERALSDPHFSLAVKIRRRIYMSLRGGYDGTRKADVAIGLLGCSFAELKRHIERQFTKGMTWDQCFNGKIHLDHILPCSSFDLTDPDQQRACFHFTNLQPLWASDNIAKGATRDLLL